MSRIIRLPEREAFQYLPLHPVQPRGIGTKSIECLTSYLTRLTLSHHMRLRRLFRFVLFPEVAQDKGISGFPRKALYSLNGNGPYAHEVVGALDQKSPTRNFEYMTWIPMEGLIGNQLFGAIDQKLKWCSACWKDDFECGDVPYVRLSWTTTINKVCPSHFVYLQNKCPHCSAVQELVPRFPRIEFCQYCAKRLDKTRKESPVVTDSNHLWHCRAISSLIRCFHAEQKYPDEGVFLRNLRAICSNSFDGKVKSMEKATSLAENCLKRVLKGENRISLRKFIDLVYRLNIDPAEMFNPTGDLMLSRPLRENPVPVFNRRDSPTEEQLARIEKRLSEVLLLPANQLPAIAKLADEFDATHGMLEYRFKSKIRAITSIRAEHQKKLAIKRRKAIVTRTLSKAHKLWASGTYPSDRNMRKNGQVRSSVLRRKDVASALRAYRREIRPVTKINTK